MLHCDSELSIGIKLGVVAYSTLVYRACELHKIPKKFNANNVVALIFARIFPKHSTPPFMWSYSAMFSNATGEK